ncbi:hypothetical protein BUALT_Bualt06G0070600 [Buddleja alternifolia]|uniref:Putative plant transposon protein domain-containing protein n=1 Tax=Buddleja alternifolia TaxID=168488 RepID=A0AAV6XET9_9LAMI|nr:hypothetical protein BUALT_Bualt06G0070600 [Buddleja alternifolia]
MVALKLHILIKVLKLQHTMSAIDSGSISEEINARCWTEFVKPPKKVITAIVHELYANVGNHANHVVKVWPSTHLSDIYVQRAGLLYVISTGLGIDVGQVIMDDILSFAKSKSIKKGLAFPSLITKLCEHVGVEWSDEKLPLIAALNNDMFKLLKKLPEFITPPNPSLVTYITLVETSYASVGTASGGK